MQIRARRTRSVYFCEQLESRLVFDEVTLIPEVQSLIDNPRLRTPGLGIAIEGPQIEGPIDAPPLAGTVEAINFDSQATAGGFYQIPPDTHGAAGPNHIVNVVNTAIQWFTKAGTLQNTQRFGHNGSTSVGSFFAARSPVNSMFDPRVLYDQYDSRFVVVALERTDTAIGDPSNTSRLMVAVSDDSDPNGTWFTAATNSKLNIGGTDTWADFPQMGIDANGIYISNNMFTFGAGSYKGSRLWIIPKTGFYTGGAATFNVYDPATLSGIATGAFSLQPAHMYGSAPGSTGTFLVNTSFTIGSNEQLSIIRIDNPFGAITFSHQYVSLGDIDASSSSAGFDVPQSGSGTTIRGGDRRMQSVVWRNNSLYTANTILPISGTDINTATVRWNRVNTTTLGALALADGGLVSGEDIAVGTRTFYPAISVDQNNNVAIGFSASGPNIFAGSYYTGRLSADAAGTVQSSGVVAAGQASYVRTFISGSPSSGNRWGDYSAISLDPSDNATFWTYNLYAGAQGTVFGGENGRWATRWGKFSFGSVPAAPSIPDLATASDSGASNIDNITNDNTPTFTGTAEAGSTVTIFANGLNVGSGPATGGNYSITTSVLANNTYSINATAANGSGPGPLSGILPVVIDTVAPTVAAATFNFLTGGTTLSYPFNENVNQPTLVAADFTIQNRHTLAFINATDLSVSYNGGTNVATESYVPSGGIIPDGSYRATVVAAGVTDVAGNSVTGTLQTDFWFLQADANRDRFVDTQDFNLLAFNFGQAGKNWIQGNFNYAGNVDSTDFGIFVGQYGKRLALPSPVLGAASGPAPALFADGNKVTETEIAGVLE